MDHALFSSVIQNLLHITVTRPLNEEDAYANFENRFCYHSALQPLFTADSLHHLIESTEDHMLYEISDRLGLCLVLFRLEEEPYIVGPFVRHEFRLKPTQAVLMDARLPAAIASSIKLYYSAFPLLGFTQVHGTVLSCIKAFSITSPEYTLCRMENISEIVHLPQTTYSDSLDYSTVYRAYDRENRFLQAIEEGNTEFVLTAYDEMVMNTSIQNRYINAVYQDPAIALSMIRALSRKAAERGGVSPIEINEITQRAVQKMFSTKHMSEQLSCTQDMILELTEAVRKAKLSLSRYSPPIRTVIEHIHLNYSQDLSPRLLADLAGFSDTYISKAFRKEAGMTISQYIARLRCSEAAKLLRDSKVSIQSISEYVGYLDNNYFVKVFRGQYGITPTEYRAGKEPVLRTEPAAEAHVSD